MTLYATSHAHLFTRPIAVRNKTSTTSRSHRMIQSFFIGQEAYSINGNK